MRTERIAAETQSTEAIEMLRDRLEEPSLPSFPNSYPSSWASQSAQVEQLVTRAMALLESDRDGALRCLRDAAALVTERTGSFERRTPWLQVRWRGGLAAWQANRALRFIEENLGARVLLADIAGCVALSKSHFARAFKRSVGSSPSAYVVARKVERAKFMMASTRQSLTGIAMACGFSDHSHFTRCFNRVVGMSPREWRRMTIHRAE